MVYSRSMGGHSELPEYTLRVSLRARRVILKVSRDRGLEVVVPRGFDRGRVPGVLDRKRDWIKRQMAGREPEAWPPDGIRLRAVDERYGLDVLERAGPGVLTLNSGGRLMLSAPDPDAARILLRSWLKDRARSALPGMLRQESLRTGLTHSRVQVRLQRSRWGSCSARGTVSLNARLLFLPPELVRHVFLHELCHLKHLNHSPEYWRLVGRFEPGYRQLEQRLKKEAGGLVPGWAV